MAKKKKHADESHAEIPAEEIAEGALEHQEHEAPKAVEPIQNHAKFDKFKGEK